MKLAWLILALLLGAAVINASPTSVNIGGFSNGPGGLGMGMGGTGQGDGLGGGALGPEGRASGWKGTIRPVDETFARTASRSKFVDRKLLQGQHGPDSWEWEGGPANTWRSTVNVKAGVKGGVAGAKAADRRFEKTEGATGD